MSEPAWVALGAAAVDYEGEWAAGTQYAPGDVVTKDGITYLAVNPSLGQTPPTYLPVPPPDLTAVLKRDGTQVNIQDTAAETTILSYALAAGQMGTDKMLRGKIFGQAMGNSPGIAKATTFRLKLDATVLLSVTYTIGPDAGTYFPTYLDFFVANLDAANKQGAWMNGFSHNEATKFTESYSGTVDTSVARTFTVTAQWTLANASRHFRKHYTDLELV